MIQDEHANALSVGISAMYKTGMGASILNQDSSTDRNSFSGFNLDYDAKYIVLLQVDTILFATTG